MLSVQRILLATDFSTCSEPAVAYAVMVAKKFGAAVHVLNVFDIEVPVMSEGLNYLPLNYFQELEKHVAEQTAQVIRGDDADKLAVTTAVRRGVPFLEIIRYAREEKIDLIVIGTHGRGMLAHVLMGNVAEKVVRMAPCPVLTVRHPQHQFAMP
jgi:nucleotide-binding universal stress UspA family protein